MFNIHGPHGPNIFFHFMAKYIHVYPITYETVFTIKMFKLSETQKVACH